jgi:hypothetical protein
MHSIMQRGLSHLPCSQLQHLGLHSCVLDFSDGSSAVCSSISTATALTSLHINKCKLLIDCKASGSVKAAAELLLSSLAPLTALQELGVSCVGIMMLISNSISGEERLQLGRILLRTTVLQPLQHLTQLQLQTNGIAAYEANGVVQHIGRMMDLQALQLGGVKGAHLQLAVTQLTALTKLRGWGCGL